jgi:hypothetical protein
MVVLEGPLLTAWVGWGEGERGMGGGYTLEVFEQGGFERVELLHLNSLDANTLNELSKHSWVGFNGCPVVAS